MKGRHRAPALSAPSAFHRDLAWLVSGAFGHGHFQHAIRVLGADLFGFHGIGQGEPPQEGTAYPLDAPVLLGLFLSLGGPLAPQGQDRANA
jgi:hypothetical protein